MKPASRRARWALLASLLLSAVATPGLTQVLTAPGATASGSGSHFYKECSTCPNLGSHASDSKGGNGFPSAASELMDVSSVYRWSASATLLTGDALPELKAYAEARVPGTIGFISASADAQALQRYHYAGSETASYTITFSVGGSLSGDGENIGAGLNVFNSGYNPLNEGSYFTTFLAGNSLSKSASTTNSPFLETRTVTFSIGAGQDFYVSAYLSAGAFWSDGGSLPGIADAAHTFTAAFTSGNAALLAPVPEPSILGLLLAGLGLMAYRVRRRGIAA
jgi:hypothetical protein